MSWVTQESLYQLYIICSQGNFYCLLEFYLYIDVIDFTLKITTGNITLK